MYPRSVGTHDIIPFVLARTLAVIVLGGLGIVILVCSAPGILRRIEQPCAACYLGAFGPPLEPYGQPFRRHGDIATAGKPPSTMAVSTPTIDPREARLDGRPLWVVPNEDDAPGSFQSDTSLSGREIDDAGAPNGGGIAYRFGPGTINMRRLRAADLVGPGAGPIGDAPWHRSDSIYLSGADGLWDGLIHAERQGRDPAPLVPAAVTPWIDSFIPHWRIAAQKELERHFPQIDKPAFGMASDVTDELFITSNRIISDPPSTATPLIYEAQSLGAGFSLLGIEGFNTLDTFRAGAPYRLAAPAIQYFHITGPADATQFFWPDVRPGSAGIIAGLAYEPWDRPTSPVQFLNLRFAAQYAANKEFSGVMRGPGGNNTLVLSLWGALHF